jgi:DNA invertase Pin-like site-specific DNA recombinase
VLIGYVRASEAEGTRGLDQQREALLAAGADPTRLYEDRASGRRDDRPGLEACLASLRPGDALVAWRLDRLGRDLRHLVDLAHELTGRGVGCASSPARGRASTPPPRTAG